MNEYYYYEIGVMPTDDIEDGYSLYVKTEKELDPEDMIAALNYLMDKELIDDTDARDAIYIQECPKDVYEWSINKKGE